jgi:hypothetical protein
MTQARLKEMLVHFLFAGALVLTVVRYGHAAEVYGKSVRRTGGPGGKS